MFSTANNVFCIAVPITVLILIQVFATGQPIEVIDKATVSGATNNNELSLMKLLPADQTIIIQSTDLVSTELPNQQVGKLSVDTVAQIGDINSATNTIDKQKQQKAPIAATVNSNTAKQVSPLTTLSLDLIRNGASEKVKKGLSSLLLQWNNIPFYGANPKVVESSTNSGLSDGASDQNIVIISPSSEEFVKSSNRHTIIRHVGRPLRWG